MCDFLELMPMFFTQFYCFLGHTFITLERTAYCDSQPIFISDRKLE